MSKEKIFIFDTTLRDGAQTEGVNFSIDDKNKIAKALSNLGVDYLEGGWPGANTLDTTFFNKPPKLGKTVLTADNHDRATGRTAEALEKIESESGAEVDLIIMVQGDEPLISPSAIDETLKHFEDPEVEIVNIMSRFRDREQFEDKNNVKVVVNFKKDALYYSREPIPSPWMGTELVPMYNQTGVIAFRRETLLRFNQMPESLLEKIESVDMNRILENGGRIRMVLSDVFTLGVDTLQEAHDAEELLMTDDTYKHYKNIISSIGVS